MKKRLVLVPFCLLIGSCVADNNSDEYIWLEDSNSAKTQEWVAKTNQNTLKALDIPSFYEIKKSRTKEGKAARIEQPFYLGRMLAKLSLPSPKSKGILRVAEPNYTNPSKLVWRDIIDFDALGAKESVRWEYDQSICNPENLNRCMVGISDDGENKVEYREFDIEKGEFVKNGLTIPTGITQLSWEDSDTLLVATTYSSAAISKSGKSTELKRLKRGSTIENAETILAREPVGGLDALPYSSDGKNYIIIHHWHDFYNGNTWVYKNKKLLKVNLPTGHIVYGVHQENLIIKTYAEWNLDGQLYPAGSMLAVNIAGDDYENVKIETLFQQTDKQSFEHVYLTKSKILLNVLSELKTYPLSVFKSEAGNWVKERIEKPTDNVLRINSASNFHEEAIVSYRGFLTPSSYYYLDPNSKKHKPSVANEPSFPTEKYKVDYRFAIGEDGVKIPYQIVYPRNLAPKKTYPTIVYVYAAYGLPRTEFYSEVIGNEWLERGGVYVIANARGGGAYGDKWHKAAMRTQKHKTYEDVATVANELIKTGITEPSKLGVYGGSLGGLASCSVAINYPELFAASVCESPLLDLIRFTELGDGNSWTSELGDPYNSEERPYLELNSPYKKIETTKKMSSPLFLTYAKDDIMHPGHARKMKAKMDKLGVSALYYEHPEGGHAGPKSREGRAIVTAVQYSYFVKKLMEGR